MRTYRRLFSLIVVLLTLSGSLTAQDDANARVIKMSSTLNLRETAGQTGAVIVELPGDTPLKLIGRTANSVWLKVETLDGQTGWVSAAYVNVLIPLRDVPVLDEPAAVTEAAPGETIVQAPATSAGGARVKLMGATLRLRTEPTTLAGILAELLPGTPLSVEARSADGGWLNVTTPDGQTGWVSAAYVDFDATAAPALPASAESITSSGANIRGVRAIYQRGQALGNRRGVFAKIGDSITTSEYALDAIGRGQYNLGAFSSLQPVIDTFLSSGFNSFTHVSAAAGPGWTTATVLEPRFCNRNVSAVECELDNIKPAIALIELGTNDLIYLPPEQFAYNLGRIVDLCIEKGVVPVLATIPYREGHEAGVNTLNDIIRGVAASRDLPVWDVKSALDGLPNRGLSGDGVHPSWPPGGWADSANFANAEALQAGHTARNLSALQVLQRVLAAMG